MSEPLAEGFTWQVQPTMRVDYGTYRLEASIRTPDGTLMKFEESQTVHGDTERARTQVQRQLVDKCREWVRGLGAAVA